MTLGLAANTERYGASRRFWSGKRNRFLPVASAIRSNQVPLALGADTNGNSPSAKRDDSSATPEQIGMSLMNCTASVTHPTSIPGRILYAAVVLLQLASTVDAQAVAVRLEVVASPDLAITAQHEWLRRLGERSFASVRIRTAARRAPGSRDARMPSPSMTQLADGSIEVTGVLTERDELALPGLTVPRSELKRVDDWLVALTAPAVEPAQPTHAFGLSAEQLVSAHNALSAVVKEPTAGQPAADVIGALRDALEVPMLVTPAAAQRLKEPYQIVDELAGLSSGTALAAVLRPLGLVMYPRAAAGRLELVVADSQSTQEFWPIGWPPEKKADKVAPDLFKFIPIDIKNARLLDALAAIGSRLKIPFLFDHNGLARADIELADVRVTVPPTKTYYQRALDRVLYEAKLRGELRVDEQGKPFFWVMPRAAGKKRR